MIRTTNTKVKSYINNLTEFDANNIFARCEGPLYIVYSYGLHFPMYIYNKQNNIWVGNSNSYSRTTTKHKTQARPAQDITFYESTSNLLKIINRFK